ncbi:REP-associated tyrosine transposase [Pseudoduganella lutea]|uniref:Transposase n=1 Tax=Pseudoduganella lutea TaxID=321985 RepID=A0A4V0Z3C8_9BURK|nr:transposase [Pseudoduganella lutea]QBE62993.1 transposase [Pseudoduganella lutea]
MSRPHRIQYPGALYHVTARGNRRASIFLDDRDHFIWRDLLSTVAERFGFIVHSYCMMPNHYHMLVETPDANLSAGAHYLNSCYAQHFNKRHHLVGHVLQGRFHAVLIDRDAHLLELSRYIPLNPVRAGLVTDPAGWQWSSYGSLAGIVPIPAWLEHEWILSQFAHKQSRHVAYRAFVEAGRHMKDPLLGMDEHTSQPDSPPLSMLQYAALYPDRGVAMAAAYHAGGCAMKAIAAHFGVSVKTVSRAAKQYRDAFIVELVSDSGVDPKVDTNSAVEHASCVGINAWNVV